MQPLARMGATVTGVDATAVNIQVAKLHAVSAAQHVSFVFLYCHTLSLNCD